MTRVVIQPAGNKFGRKHFVDTIENPVEISRHRELLGKDFYSLNELADEGKLAFWGVTPGKNKVNVNKFKKLSTGDVVFFTRDSKVFCTAEIAYLFSNQEFAKALWNVDPDNQTWENMYALINVTFCDIPYPVLRNAIGSDSGDNFMGFRPLDLAKSKGALALLGIEDFTWDLEVGAEIKRSELHDKFGGARRGGIEPSAKTPNIFLFTTDEGGEFGYNFDEELEDGTFLYTGDGQIGDQDPDTGGNKSIIEHRNKGRSLRLFEESGKKSYVRYLGEFELGNLEPEYRIAPDRNGNERSVLVFHLTPVGKTKMLTKQGKSSSAVTVSFQEPEKNVSDSHERSTRAVTRVATRREAQLQNRYIQYLRALGKDVGTVLISIPESNAPLRVDLVDKSDLRIIEVKAGITRGYVREAVGQVLDYVFQLKRDQKHAWKPAILLPGLPSNDLVGLIEALDIELIWEVEHGFKSRRGPLDK